MNENVDISEEMILINRHIKNKAACLKNYWNRLSNTTPDTKQAKYLFAAIQKKAGIYFDISRGVA